MNRFAAKTIKRCLRVAYRDRFPDVAAFSGINLREMRVER
jgi:hypothetical protein